MSRQIRVRQAGRRPAGLGQTLATSLPACSDLSAAQTVPQGILIAGGGIATLVGVIGAIASDQYKQDFAIAAGCGLVASFIGGLWAVNSVASCIGGSIANAVTTSGSATGTATVATPDPGY